MTLLGSLCLFLLAGFLAPVHTTAHAQEWEAESSLDDDTDMKEWNNRIRIVPNVCLGGRAFITPGVGVGEVIVV